MICCQVADALTPVHLILVKLWSTQAGLQGLTQHTIRDLSQRRCKQRIDLELFAHGMDPVLPAQINPLESSPVAEGYQRLFDAEDSETDPPPFPFFVLNANVGGKNKLHAYLDCDGNCSANISTGPWLIDVFRWATQYTDPRRFADLYAAGHVVRKMVRGGHVRAGSADITVFCCDDNGFGGDLRIQLFTEGLDPVWPYITSENGEPNSRDQCNLYVKLDRQTLFHVRWGQRDGLPVVSVYSELGHFHEPLLRWAQSQ
jgi:hypothetical protein